MKQAILMAVAGGLLATSAPYNRPDKKHDLFYRADTKTCERKAGICVKNVDTKSLYIYRSMA